MKKTIITISILVMCNTSYAGLYALTYHSRANCAGFNETVSWHAAHNYWFWTVSRHKNAAKNLDHQLVANWAYTWRSAAFDTKDGSGGWTVEGNHWRRASEGALPYRDAFETVSDCSIYDGWWS